MLTSSGAKLLDFGLAKWRESGSRPLNATALPTAAADVTTPGAVMGTVQYMAPEQLEGRDTDTRTDIFAFGLIVYEMLTGKRAFAGKSRAILIASILTGEPDPLTEVQPTTPLALEHTVARCLQKDPEERWQTAHDVLVRLQWIAGGGAGGAPATVIARQHRRERRVLIALGVFAFLAAVLAFPAILYMRGSAEPDAFEFRMPVLGLSPASIAVSPDGQSIAFVLRPNTQEPAALYVRPVGSLASRRLGGTEEAGLPFWSPDSKYVAFVTGGKLKKVEASGGPPQNITDAADFTGGSWNGEGTILFGSRKGLFRVSSEGGKAEPVTTVEGEESGHFWPHFMPDGRSFLYLVWSEQVSNRAIFSGSLDSKARTKRMAAESNVAYAPGYLFFHREATLFAQPFNAKKLAFSGDAVHVADGLGFNSGDGRGNFDVSQNGTLIYFQGATAAAASGRGQTAATVQFGWVSPSGLPLGAAGEAGPFGDMDLSPDGKLVAVTRQETGAPGADIWMIDWQRAGVATRLTLDPGDDINPVWAPDSARLAFTSYRKGNADIYVMNVTGGAGGESPLLETPANESVKAWSSDGRYIAYLSGQDNNEDIYVLPLTADGKAEKPVPLVPGPFLKGEPQFSFDGKWLAYTANKNGTFQVYVTSLPAGDQTIQISVDGGGQPRWRKDGKELYYRTLDNRIMAVDIKAGAKVEPGAPRFLFVPIVANPMTTNPTRHQLAVTPDGQRFLLRVPPGQQPAAGAGGRSSVPTISPVTNIQSVASAAPRGGRGAPANGFTVRLHWTSALREAGKAGAGQ
jgi:Tol biopolymer transport system component